MMIVGLFGRVSVFLVLVGCGGGSGLSDGESVVGRGSDSGSGAGSEEPVVDADGDGIPNAEDCDDGDPTRWRAPGAPVELLENDTLPGFCEEYCARAAVDVELTGVSEVQLGELHCLTEVEETLRIAQSSGLVALDGLSSLEHVSSLQLVDLGVTSLDPLVGVDIDRLELAWLPQLTALSPLGGEDGLELFRLIGCSSLTDLAGLAGVPLTGSVMLEYNPTLASLSGLDGAEELSYLVIKDNESLVDLTGLVNLRHVSTDLQLLESPTADLSPLSSLESVEYMLGIGQSEGDAIILPASLERVGELSLHDNPAVTRINASGLTTVTDEFSIVPLGAATELNLGRLQTVGGRLSLTCAEGVADIPEFDALTTVGGALHISDCSDLSDVTGFPLLSSLGSLVLSDLPSLVGTAGLRSTTTLDGDLVLINTGLPALDDLGQITSVGGQLVIHDQRRLASLDGLLGVVRVGGDVAVRQLPCLTDSDAQAFVDSIPSVGGTATVQGNGPGAVYPCEAP